MCGFTFETKKSCVVPTDFTKHVNEQILPEIDPTASIHVSTVTHWIKLLGLRYSEVKKGMYVDGNEREDFVAYRTQFLERMKIYEPFMPQFVGPEMESESWPARDAIILVTHDESTITAHDGQKKLWLPDSEQPLRKKVAGRSIHVSEFLTDDGKSIILEFFAHYFDQELTFSVSFKGVDYL